MTAAPYASSREHLWDELARIDRLVRAQTILWRLTVGAAKPESLWGMVHVTDEEVDAYLNTPFRPPSEPPPNTDPRVAAHQEEARRLRREIAARRTATPPERVLRLQRLQAAFGLTELELDILLVCLLPELDGRYRRLYGYLQDDVSQSAPPVELVLDILRLEAPWAARRAALQEGGGLRAHGLVVVPDGRRDDRPLAARPIRLDDRIAAWLLGEDTLDARLAGVLCPPAEPLPWEQLTVEAGLLDRLQALTGRVRRRGLDAPVLLLNGPDGAGRLAAARALCSAAGIPVLVASVPAALREPEPFELVVDLCVREAALQDAALYWAGCEALLADGGGDYRWDRLLAGVERSTGPTFLAVTGPWQLAGRLRERPLARLDFALPGFAVRRRLWARYLPAEATTAELLANDFQLGPGQMLDAVTAARARAAGRDPLDPRVDLEDLREGCRQQSGRRLAEFARRIQPALGLTFDDLVLPTASRQQLDELRMRIRLRGKLHGSLGFERRLANGQGLVAMFTGASGTGKTMAAELLAGERGVDLYKIDLSAVVSKYVGETEKHVSRLFAEAEGANAILFFDEADALFGKRGEVRDARDRWANLEVNHLLQQIEAFSGPVILASNLSQNIDEAFLRRIHAIVDFPFPDAAARLRIWRGMFPAKLQRPCDEELKILADRFRLPGGSIRNIVLDAASRTLAEGNGSPLPFVHLRHLAQATAREYQKLGKPITRGEFGEELYGWVDADLLQHGTGTVTVR